MEVSGRNQTGNDDAQTGVECDPCLFDSKNMTSEWFCTDCNEFLCSICADIHRKYKVTRNHKLLDRDEMPSKKLTNLHEKFCSKHGGEMIKYFCEKHEQLCCSVCVTLEHNQCGVLYIDDIAGGFITSQEYQDLLKQIELLEIKLAKTKKQSEKNSVDVNQFFATLISDIQYVRTQINTKLDKLESKVIEEAQKIKTEDLKSMESISTKSETIKNQLREMSSTLEILEKYKQNQQIFVTAKRSLKQVTDYNKDADNISLDNNIRNYFLSWNEEVLQSLDSCCELVHLNAKESEKRHLLNEKQCQVEENIMYKNLKRIKAKFVKKINTEDKQDSNSDCWITGSDLLTCDTLALADRKSSSVKLVDLHTDTITSCLQLTDKPIDLTCVDSKILVVTCYTNLTFLKFDGKLSVMKQIPMEDGCHGITSHQNKLFVTFIRNPSVKILNSGGAVLHTIQTDSQGQNLFDKPQYITLSTDGQTIYVSDWKYNSVTSYRLTGESLNIYKHEVLNGPVGMTVIENKFIFVCGLGSRNVHDISCLCEHIQIVLDRKNVGDYPLTVLYNRTNNMIYVSCGGCNFLSVFKLG